ncbi:MAG TPA: hypothetical protein DCE42_08665 [Myxococcales bacterium]|nr:hypothetical protein [Myxococcales bacterium]|tara:strand:+ start:4090 stop:4269 length:180 start_codon:yes stop_codon:yes gene_type:complete
MQSLPEQRKRSCGERGKVIGGYVDRVGKRRDGWSVWYGCYEWSGQCCGYELVFGSLCVG